MTVSFQFLRKTVTPNWTLTLYTKADPNPNCNPNPNPNAKPNPKRKRSSSTQHFLRIEGDDSTARHWKWVADFERVVTSHIDRNLWNAAT